MKWFVVLLVLLAGGLTAAALAVPTNAAVVNGTKISQQTLNSDVSAIAGSADYQCYLRSQAALSQQQLPSVVGAGKGENGQHTTATTAFTATYLDTEVGHQLIYQLADRRGIVLTSAQLADARRAYEAEISGVMQNVASQTQDPSYTCGAPTPLTGQVVLGTLPASFVNEQVRFYATSSALAEDFSGVGSSESALQAYFVRHQSDFDTICWTVAVYTSQSAAASAQVQAQSTPFSQVAKTAASGGAEPCEPLPAVTAMLPSSVNLNDLTVGTVSSPISLGSNEYVLIQITSRHPTEYTTARPLVQQQVQSKGATKTQSAVRLLAQHSDVSIDPRYGNWMPNSGQILVPFAPTTSDVLNPVANSTGLAPASSTPSGG